MAIKNNNSWRSTANELAAQSCSHHQQARSHHQKTKYYKKQVDTIRNKLSNSPYQLFFLIYMLLIVTDAFIMKPIIAVVIEHGFQMTGKGMLVLFVLIYIILVAALTIGVGYGFGKLLDPKLFDIQVTLEKIFRRRDTEGRISDEVKSHEKWEQKLGGVFGVLLLALLLSLSLYRNYIVNDFSLKVDSPDDWVNILIPLALALALCFFGIYKDITFRLFSLKQKQVQYKKNEIHHQMLAKKYGNQAVEYEFEALKFREQGPTSADLVAVLHRYKEKSKTMEDFYKTDKYIKVKLLIRNFPVQGFQIAATTEDDEIMFKTTNEEGLVEFRWNSDCEKITQLVVEGMVVNGTLYSNGIYQEIDLETLIESNGKQLDGYLLKKLRFLIGDKYFLQEIENPIIR